MVDNAEFPYRIAVGWITKAALEASDAYLLSAFAVQSDQFSANLFPWGPPDDTITTWPEYTRYGQHSIQTQWADGPVNFQWGLKFLTELMQAYYETLIWTSDFAVQTRAVTIKHRRAADSNAFGVWQGYANRPIPNKAYKRGTRGVVDYIMPFVGGIEILV